MYFALLVSFIFFFFFKDTATTEIYTYSHTLSLHDALPISAAAGVFTGADAEHAGLIEMCPGIGGFVIGCMQACERQQFGKRVVHRVRKRQLEIGRAHV